MTSEAETVMSIHVVSLKMPTAVHNTHISVGIAVGINLIAIWNALCIFKLTAYFTYTLTKDTKLEYLTAN